MQEAPRGVGQVLSAVTLVTLSLSLLLGTLVLARRNVRLGRGDRRGAFRVAAFLLIVSLLGWLLGAHHVADLAGEAGMFAEALAFALLGAAFVWLTYVALEPFARRRWPSLLVSWTRLLSGRLLTVVYSERGKRIRIISARKANNDEQRDYDRGKAFGRR